MTTSALEHDGKDSYWQPVELVFKWKACFRYIIKLFVYDFQIQQWTLIYGQTPPIAGQPAEVQANQLNTRQEEDSKLQALIASCEQLKNV